MNAAVLGHRAVRWRHRGRRFGAVRPEALCWLDDEALLAHFRSRARRVVRAGGRPEETRPTASKRCCRPLRVQRRDATLGRPDRLAANPSVDIEWHILLHKFYYAPGLGAGLAAHAATRATCSAGRLTDGWMRSTPPGFIAADVTGRRVQNWIYSLHYLVLHDGGAPLDGAFLRRLLHSLHEQVEFLCAHLTPKRNHRTLELLAIMLAGVACPEFERAAHWREFALARDRWPTCRPTCCPTACTASCRPTTTTWRCATGCRCAAGRAQRPWRVPAGMDEALQRGFEFSLHVHQPQGLVPSLSDGDVHSYLPLLAQAAELFDRDDMRFVATRAPRAARPQRNAHFPTRATTCCAAPGTMDRSTAGPAPGVGLRPAGRGQPRPLRRAELRAGGPRPRARRGPGPLHLQRSRPEVNWRVHFRSTAAHNTVCVDGRNQTRYAPKPIKEPSRHARASAPQDRGPAPATTLLEAASSPRLDLLHGRAVSAEYDAVHERVIAFIDQRYWIVSDSLRSQSLHHYAMRLQLSAAAQGLAVLDDGVAHELHSPGLAVAVARAPGQHCEIESGLGLGPLRAQGAAPRLCVSTEGCDVDLMPC
jgi:hypothetical protein